MITDHGIIRDLLGSLFQIGNRTGEDILFVINPSEGIRDVGVIRKLFLGALG